MNLQTFVYSSFLNLIIYSFSLPLFKENDESFGFELLVE